MFTARFHPTNNSPASPHTRLQVFDGGGLTGELVVRNESADLLLAMLAERPDADLCPDHLKESLDRFIVDGIPTGSCLAAILSGDLVDAIGRADFGTRATLPHIVAYIRDKVPSRAIGSRVAVANWIEEKRARRNASRS